MSLMKKKTRSATRCDFIGQPSSSITRAKRPTVQQVLNFFLFATQIAETRNEAFEETIAEVEAIWDMARIKTMEVKVCKKKKTHQVVGRKVIYAEEQHTCDWRKAEKFRENLDKI